MKRDTSKLDLIRSPSRVSSKVALFLRHFVPFSVGIETSFSAYNRAEYNVPKESRLERNANIHVGFKLQIGKP